VVRAVSRLLIVGESRPDGNPGDAFEDGSSAQRLLRLFGVRIRDELLDVVDVVNWSDDGLGWEAAEMGSECFAALEVHECLVLLGRGVQKQFKLRHKYYVWDVVDSWYVATMPHPSQRNRVWNDPTAEERAKIFLDDAVELAVQIAKDVRPPEMSVLPSAWMRLLAAKERE
jgi:hypothetical protein